MSARRKTGRRDRGEGGLHFKHARTCPPLEEVVDKDGRVVVDKNGKAIRERPPHRKCGGAWVARVDLGKDGVGKRISKEVSSRDYATAVKKLREIRRQKEDHGTVPRGGMTVERWLHKWLDEIVAVTERPTTAKSYRSICETLIIPTIGKRHLDKLTVQHVRDMQATLRQRPSRRGGTLAESSILKAHNVLSSALTAAWREGHVMRNVCVIADKPRPVEDHEGTLTTAQVKHFLRANADQPLAPRWTASMFTGERQGEILGMEWDRVDLETGMADVSWQLQRIAFRHGCGGTCGKKRPGSCPERALDVPPSFTARQLDGGLCLTRPKTKKGRRLIPLHPFLVAVLLAHRARQGDNPHGLVFTREDGRPIDPRIDLEQWKEAMVRAGLPANGTHFARHVVAQHLRSAGTDRDVMKDLLGHTSAGVTSVYLTRDMELARAAMVQMGDAFALED